MQQLGKVVEVENGSATVRFTRTPACEHCGACMHFGENEAQVTLKNTINAKQGDHVRVELHAKSFLQASFMAYIGPLCFLIAGIIIGSMWSDFWGVLLGLFGAVFAFLLLRVMEPRFARMAKFNPRMISIETAQLEETMEQYELGGKHDE